MTLAEDRRWVITICRSARARGRAVDVCGIVAIAAGFERIFQADLLLACVLVGVTYHVLATLALGQSVTVSVAAWTRSPAHQPDHRHGTRGAFYVMHAPTGEPG